jgi:methionyl-tRNA synthetase
VTVTAALPYANGPAARCSSATSPGPTCRRTSTCAACGQRGKEVLFICGSDEHGAAITMRAMKEGTTPRAIVDKYHTC